MGKQRSLHEIERERRHEARRYVETRLHRARSVVNWARENDADDWWRKYQVESLFENGASGPFFIKHFTVASDNPRRYEYMMEGGKERDCGSGRFVSICQDDTLWMSDTRAEIVEHKPVFDRLETHGAGATVLINGLGLGMIARAALMHNAAHVTVIEKSADVIELTAPIFTNEERQRLTIINADAYAAHLDGYWDIVWHDIWPDISDDNLPGMERLKRYYYKRAGWQACWQEDGCREMDRMYKLAEEWSRAKR